LKLSAIFLLNVCCTLAIENFTKIVPAGDVGDRKLSGVENLVKIVPKSKNRKTEPEKVHRQLPLGSLVLFLFLGT